MPDPLSIASGAVGIISLGLTIAQGLFQIADGIGSAGQEVRSYAEEINAFSKLLNRVKIELESSTEVSADIQSLINDVVDICNRVLKPLDGIQNALKPLLDHFRSSPSKFQQLGIRLQWVFRKKDKVLFYRKALKEQHRILDTILEVMILQTTRDRCLQNTYITQLCLQNSMAAVDLSHRATRQLNFEICIEESSPHVLTTTRALQPADETITAPVEAGFGAGDLHEGAFEDDVALASFSAAPNDTGEEISKQATLIVDGRIEHELNSESLESAQEIWYDICALQRKVLRHASRLLQSEFKPEMAANMSNPKDYTVGLICAGTTEYVATRSFLDAEHQGAEYTSPYDTTTYTLGKVGKHNVVIAHLSDEDIGISSAAVIAGQMKNSFPNVAIGLMVGIGGGVPGSRHDIRLGDVVVSVPRDGIGGVFQYDLGKIVEGQQFQPTGFLNQPPIALLAAVRELEVQREMKGNRLEDSIARILEENPRLETKYSRPCSDKLFRADFVHSQNHEVCEAVCDPSALVPRPERRDEDKLAIHFGLIASGNTVMKDTSVRDRLAAETGVLCFDTAAAGVMNYLPCLVICGIYSYADSHNCNEWRGYAAMAAAAYMKELLYKFAPRG